MANIPLRAYIREIEGLLDSRQYEDTIAHCRHILQVYPKHVDTYRLLGKVFLETKQLSNATDILQRILSAIADDFVSHIGMSIIREDEGNLDAALWHMERAFESQPANKAIQDELRRLFGRRDGVEPPRIRLTRGALAKMYVKGNLYEQAIAELRGALSEDPQRIDLLVLLAQMNYLVGNKVEAVDTCSNILKKLPYSLMANRILALILPQTERAEDAKIYQQRSNALDPYLSKAEVDALTSEDVSDGIIMIETLERKPGESLEGMQEQPAWADTLGIKFDGTSEEALPDWLKEDMTIPSYEGKQIAPFVDEESAEAQEITGDESEEQLPDWMTEIVKEVSSEESVSPLTPEIDSEMESPEGVIEKGDIPDWLREYADLAPSDEVNLDEVSSEETLPPWLDETTPGPTDSIINWLEERGESDTTPEPEIEVSSKQAVEIPDWLLELDEEEHKDDEIPQEDFSLTSDFEDKVENHEDEVTEEIPEWLKDISEQAGKPEEIEVTIETPAVQTEDFDYTESKPEEYASKEELSQEIVSAPSDDIGILAGENATRETLEILPEDASLIEEIEMPDWLRNIEEDEESPFSDVLDETVDIPEWLQELSNEKEYQEISEESLRESAQDTTTQPEELVDVKDTIESEVSVSAVITEEELPEWVIEVSESEEELEHERTHEITDEDSGLAWLESLVEKQVGLEEELRPSPEDQQTDVQDWIEEEVKETDVLTGSKIDEELIQERQSESKDWDESLIKQPESQDLEIIVGDEIEGTSQATINHDIEVNLNSGSLVELESIPGVGFVIAQSIIDYREKHGPFTKIEDLINVPEIGEKRFNALKDHFVLLVPEESLADKDVDQATTQEDEGQLDKAISALEADDIDFAVEVFEKFIKSGQNLDEIIALLDTHTIQTPDNILLLQTLGDAYMHHGQFQKALDTYTKAEKLL